MDSSKSNASASNASAVQGSAVQGTAHGTTARGTAVVQELWDRMQARDWPGVAEVLAEDVVVEWPVSGERIVGRENYVRINAEYPEGWSIHVLRLVAEGDQVVSEVEVPHESMGVHRVASFWTVREGRITAAREYWTESGSDPRPEWRAGWVEPMDQG